MSRPRKHAKGLPTRVTLKHGAYYYILHKDGRDRWVRLGKDFRAAMAAYAEILRDGSARAPGQMRMPDLVAEWKVTRLLGGTANGAKPYSAKTVIEYTRMLAGISQAFADFKCVDVRPGDIAKFIDMNFIGRSNSAKKHKALLSLLFRYAVWKEYCQVNPAEVLKLDGYASPAKRDRYITDSEFDCICGTLQAEIAKLQETAEENRREDGAMRPGDAKQIRSRVMLLCLVQLAYISAQRIGDLLGLEWPDVIDEGIEFKPRKTVNSTAVKLRVQNSDDLARVMATARSAGVSGGLTVIQTGDGRRLTYSGADSAWKRLLDRARKCYIAECKHAGEHPKPAFLQNVHFHDLRAKSLTDASRQGLDAQKLAGHATAAMTADYVKRRLIEVVRGPSIRQPG